jgi:N-methylhydantoinase A/oxoprolinase/acetone carboxylase beta subunit
MIEPVTNFYLGIDTGGTFTDGVLFDPVRKAVIKQAKVITTHSDLTICIRNLLYELLKENKIPISLVSLSTTLATNAIVEEKRKPIALMLIGYDQELVEKYKLQSQFGTNYYYYISGKHDLNGLELIPLDEENLIKVTLTTSSVVTAFAISSYSGPMNSDQEKLAANIINRFVQYPVVQAHHLTNELDSIRRATTVSLNASLLPHAQEFILAVQQMMKQWGIECPVMIVKGDGSIVGVDYARNRPVEIIHSGPATSTIGGHFLAGVDSALIIDIGGTTTDISQIHNGRLDISEKTATVGSFRTCVRTIKTRSFGLGGDSLIHFELFPKLDIGPEKVIPLSRFFFDYPDLLQDFLTYLTQKREILHPIEFEYWYLRKEPKRTFNDERTNRAIKILSNGPIRLKHLLKLVGVVSPFQIDAGELIKQDIIERSGLTPTDILHVCGEYSPWNVDAARVALTRVSERFGLSVDHFIRNVRQSISEKITLETIEFLSGCIVSENNYGYHHSALDRWLINQSYTKKESPMGCAIYLNIPIIGIGAPAKSFLPDVAKLLGTDIIFPEHYSVANAVGTVVGNIYIQFSGEVFPRIEGAYQSGYFGRVDNHQSWFDQYKDAVDYVYGVLHNKVVDETKIAGAGKIEIDYYENMIADGIVKITVSAIGKPSEIYRKII